MHASKKLNYYLPDNFFEDLDGSTSSSITITPEITSSCNTSWIWFDKNLRKFYGQMPIELFKTQSTLNTSADIRANKTGADVSIA